MVGVGGLQLHAGRQRQFIPALSTANSPTLLCTQTGFLTPCSPICEATLRQDAAPRLPPTAARALTTAYVPCMSACIACASNHNQEHDLQDLYLIASSPPPHPTARLDGPPAAIPSAPTTALATSKRLWLRLPGRRHASAQLGLQMGQTAFNAGQQYVDQHVSPHTHLVQLNITDGD
jgi:hypothetical protein